MANPLRDDSICSSHEFDSYTRGRRAQIAPPLAPANTPNVAPNANEAKYPIAEQHPYIELVPNFEIQGMLT